MEDTGNPESIALYSNSCTANANIDLGKNKCNLFCLKNTQRNELIVLSRKTQHISDENVTEPKNKLVPKY